MARICWNLGGNKCFVCFPRRTPAGKLDIVVEIVAVFTKFRDHEDVASVWPALLDATRVQPGCRSGGPGCRMGTFSFSAFLLFQSLLCFSAICLPGLLTAGLRNPDTAGMGHSLPPHHSREVPNDARESAVVTGSAPILTRVAQMLPCEG